MYYTTQVKKLVTVLTISLLATSAIEDTLQNMND